MRIVHLRDDLIILAYASNEICIKNIITNETIARVQIDQNEPLIDVDVYRGNEKQVLVGFRSENCCLVDMVRGVSN